MSDFWNYMANFLNSDLALDKTQLTLYVATLLTVFFAVITVLFGVGLFMKLGWALAAFFALRDRYAHFLAVSVTSDQKSTK